MLSADHRPMRNRSMVSSSHSTAAEPIQRIFKVLDSQDEYDAVKKADKNACCFVFVSPAICPATKEVIATAQELSESGQADNIDFYICDVNAPVGVVCAKREKIASLPSFAFYFDSQKLEEFSGDSVDKLRVCCQATRGKRMQINKQKEKEKEEADKAKAAAEQEAALAAAAAAKQK